jgi:acetyl esterase/lipase
MRRAHLGIACLLLAGAATAVLAQEKPEVLVEKDLVYGKAGDRALKLDLYRPAAAPPTPLPAIVWIHGGGWLAGTKANPPGARAAAQRGYVYASVEYRLSQVAPFPAAVDDCRAAVTWLRQNAKTYALDPDRIGVWGASAGGHLALMVACVDSSTMNMKAVCSWFGPTDLQLKPDRRQLSMLRPFLGGTLEEKPDLYREASPVTHVTKNAPPTLMIHGEKDDLVPISQSEAMQAKLEAAHVESTLIRVKEAGHGFSPSQGKKIEPSSDEIMKATLEFFDRHLKPS